MRKLVLLIMVLLLGLPALGWAARRGPGDGSLEVQRGRGIVAVNIRGIVFGRIDSGRLFVGDPFDGDGPGPVVSGYERVREIGLTMKVYIGDNMRFRMLGGRYRVRIEGVGIDLSAVGKGFAILNGGGFFDAGRYSVDDGPFQPMPSSPTRIVLGTPPPGGGPPPVGVGPRQ
jgi:hypothetical protein